MDAITALLSRSSSSVLQDPAPIGAQREIIFQAGLRASDHGRLHPWRFLVIEGDARQHFGNIFVECYKRKNQECSLEQLEIIFKKAIRAPLIVVAISRVNDKVKIPAIEQILSSAAAAQLMLVAAHALGFAGVWKTGEVAYDRFTHYQLDLSQEERIIGFLYFGTAVNPSAYPPTVDSEKYFHSWEKSRTCRETK